MKQSNLTLITVWLFLCNSQNEVFLPEFVQVGFNIYVYHYEKKSFCRISSQYTECSYDKTAL